MANTKMQLHDWLDDLCVRFIINLPEEELASVERICFQVEEAQWFYEDFVRPLDASLPHLNLRQFCLLIFQHCPLFAGFSAENHIAAYSEFLAYKTRVPVRGAIMLNDNMDEVVLVKGWKKGANWSFPRGKINKDERDLDCAVREVYEETGFDVAAAGLALEDSQMKSIEITMRDQHMKLYVFRGVPKETVFQPRTRKEISKIEWYKLSKLPGWHKKRHGPVDFEDTVSANKLYMVAPFLAPLKRWIAYQRKMDSRRSHDPYETEPYSEEHLTEDHLRQDENTLPWQNLSVQDTSQTANVSASPNDSNQIQTDIVRDRDPKIETTTQLKQLLSISPRPAVQDSHAQQLDQNSMNLLSMLQQPQEIQKHNSVHLGESALRNSRPVHRGNQTLPEQHSQPDDNLDKRSTPSGWHPSTETPSRPYQRISDPQSTNPHQWSPPQFTDVPEASKLPTPKLSGHAQTLLDVLKGGKAAPVSTLGSTGDNAVAPSSWAAATQASDLKIAAHSRQKGHPQPQTYQQTFQQTSGNSAEARRVVNSSKIDCTGRSTIDVDGRPLPGGVTHSQPDHSHSRTRDNLLKDVVTIPHSESTAVSSPPPGTQLTNTTSSMAASSALKPTSQQDTLLNLFRAPSAPRTPKAEPPYGEISLAPGPVELSAIPSPGLASKNKHASQHLDTHAMSSRMLSSSVLPRSTERGSLSATVSGPQKIPELEKVRQTSNAGHQNNKVAELPQQTLQMPVQILRPPAADIHDPTAGATSHAYHPQSPSPVTADSTVFQPRILRRPSQGQNSASKSPRRTNAGQFDRRQSTTDDQKQALLSLFGKPHISDTARTHGTSGMASPASALSDREGSKEIQTPASGFAKSRVNSVGNDITSPRSELSRSRMNSYGAEQKETVAQSSLRKGSVTPISPSDRGFLLNYLEGVVTKGR